MLKINISGQDEHIELPNGAGLTCRARNIDMLDEAFENQDEARESFSVNQLCRLIAPLAVTGWWGLCDEEGHEIAFDPDLIDALMSDPVVLSCFRDQYVTRMITLNNEGNGSRPSQDGTTAEVEPIAQDAKPPVPNAPTRSTRPVQ